MVRNKMFRKQKAQWCASRGQFPIKTYTCCKIHYWFGSNVITVVTHLKPLYILFEECLHSCVAVIMMEWFFA